MTRCLNCGAERTEDVCPSCGLGADRAELLLRRRILNRTGLFLLGALAFVVASGQYPPLELDGILIFVGVLFFLTLALAVWVERRALHHLEVEALKRVYYGLVPLPWLLGALLLVNGAFDHKLPTSCDAKVLGKFSMSGSLPFRRLVVTSCRDGRHLERITVSRADFDRFQPGDMVVVHIRGGVVGIPWVDGVNHP